MDAVVDKELVFPAVRGCDIKRWGIDSSLYAIVPQNPTQRRGFAEDWMIENLPDTYRYFLQFKDLLLEKALFWKYFSKTIKSKIPIKDKVLATKARYFRALGQKEENGKKFWGYQLSDAPFYSVFNVGTYSFSQYRVIWSRMSDDMHAAVCVTDFSDPTSKTPIATDTTTFVSVKSEKEAHYLCGLLNSTLIRDFIKSFSSAGRCFGVPSVLSSIAIPDFNEKNEKHLKLASLSEAAHAAFGDKQKLSILEQEINTTARLIVLINP